MTLVRAKAAVGLIACICASSALAQFEITSTGTVRKILEIARFDDEPVIDGVLDDEVWNRATVIADLHQVDPVEFAEPSEDTEVLIFYTHDALFVAARLRQKNPDDITAQVLRQGEGLGSEDRFIVILDPNFDRRSGYRFQLNPNGVRWDAIYEDTSRTESNWDGIWQGDAVRDGSGWTAEMRIPFKTLSFNPNTTEWGVNFVRTIQIHDETIAWVSRNRQYNPAIAGIATGFENLEQGRGLDVVPSVSVRGNRLYGPAGSDDSTLDPSLDVFYKLTPSLNGSLTINTDFSATEIDDRQVNLTRFSLFFPEKRDFFLQDSDIFGFGSIGGGGGGNRGRGGGGGGGDGNNGPNNPSVPQAARNNGLPFFSRKLGLSPTGEPIDIDYGGKLSGRVGRWNIGALAIHQDQWETLPETDIFVGRMAANVLEESAVGVIFTDGNPQADLDGSLAGADFRYRNTRLPGGRTLEGQAWVQKTEAENLDGDGNAYGIGVASPNSTGWRGGFAVQEFEKNYSPAVGFANRTDIRDYQGDLGYRHRFGSGWLRSVYGGFTGYRVDGLTSGDVESENYGLLLTLNNNTGDNIFSRVIHQREVLLEDFVIYTSPDGTEQVVIPPGDYTFNSFFVGSRTGEQRPFSGGFRFNTGEFYSGDHLETEVNMVWRPSPKLSLESSYGVDDIKLPTGDFTVRLSRLQVQYVFSSTLSLSHLIQYDNVSENLGVNIRLHWIPEAGREGFVVFNHNLVDTDQDGSFRSASADLSVKFSYTFRF